MAPSLVLALLLSGAAGESPAPPVVAIKWEKKFDQALRKAKRAGKPLIVQFWVEWSEWCHRLDRTTYPDPAVVRLAADFIPVKVNTEGSSRELAVAKKYRVWSLPTILFLSPEGHQLFRVNGFQGPGQFPHTLDAAKRVATRVMAWEAALEANPDDPAALVALGSHLYQQEYFEEAHDLLRKATRQDAAAPVDDRRQARLLLAMLANATHDYAEAERLVKEALTLQPDSEEQPQLLFVLGRTYVSWGRQEEGVATFEVIVREYPRSPVAQKAKETLSSLRHR